MSFYPLFFVFILTGFLGVELLSKVPSKLHTPLMSGTNAVSGVTLLGAIVGTANANGIWLLIGIIAVVVATINVVGGYFVTHRMIKMLQKK